MATQVQWRRGTTAQVNAFIGAIGEIVVDTQTHQMAVQDGSTAGGFRTALAASGTLNNPTFTGTVTFQSCVLAGLVTASTLTITGGTYVSPALTLSPTAPTPIIGNSSTLIATTAFVQAALTFNAPINLPLATVIPLLTNNSAGGT